jgi:hypothetical protein
VRAAWLLLPMAGMAAMHSAALLPCALTGACCMALDIPLTE